MKFTTIASLGFAGLASAAICNNNCGRAVAGTARNNPPFAARQSMCSEFLTTYTTVTPPAATVTEAPIYARNVHGPRDEVPSPVITGEKPAYASSCPDITAYWNACQCFGIAATVVTVTAPTPTETVPGMICTQGAEFALYAVPTNSPRSDNLQRAYENQASISLDLQLKNVQPDVTGVTPTVGMTVVGNYFDPIRIYGIEGPPGSTLHKTVINHRAFIIPKKVGTYNVILGDADDLMLAWVGQTAISGWDFGNANARSWWPSGGPRQFAITVTAENLEKPIPFRLFWANEGGPGGFTATITDPEGIAIWGRNTAKNPSFVSSCSVGGENILGWNVSWPEERGN
ncbi:GLEYA domain-containing protein [Stachybotrys elegans]|uniref:GLEYA domain-containing protein n=1 Tax=Stachybotrys elegans TaxID=80388 RepID=A0A8K0SPV6_9HYPO|nr:GLEYA domain-containing protein [Stachybotrys elegans]